MTRTHDVDLDNAPRFPDARGGHVESWFFRANAPDRARALWIKATVLAPREGPPVAELWCSLFDDDHTFAAKHTLPLAEAHFDPRGASMRIGDGAFTLDPSGGTLRGRVTRDGAAVSWDLRFERAPGPLGAPLLLLPARSLLSAGFPRNKLVTPFPLAAFHGTVDWAGETFAVDRWWGMQGHNWGAAHAPEYAWGQCVFTDARGEPFALAEGASGRLQLGPVRSQLISMLTVRVEDREVRFDRLLDRWRQRPRLAFPEWDLTMRSGVASAALSMRAAPERMVCLGYRNPDDRLSYCLNSKTAAVTLRLNAPDMDGVTLYSPSGGALEFLQPTPEPRVGAPV